jgi:hypothetical protein
MGTLRLERIRSKFSDQPSTATNPTGQYQSGRANRRMRRAENLCENLKITALAPCSISPIAARKYNHLNEENLMGCCCIEGNQKIQPGL